MAKKKKETLPSFGTTKKEEAKEFKPSKYKTKYKIGDEYMVELATNNMLYYKKYDPKMGIFQIVRAKSVETQFGSKELFELATDLGEKLKLTVS